jgi:hypothetical protein
MSDKPPFDAVKACFYLIAFVIFVHCIVVILGAAACLTYVNEIIEQKWKCDPQGRLSELLSGALAAALAFAGGFTRNR